MKRRQKLGIQAAGSTFTACKLSFKDAERADYLTFDSMIRHDQTGIWLHAALPVVRLEVKPALLAGIPRKKPSLPEVRDAFEQMAAAYSLVVPSCEENLDLENLGRFLLYDLWEAGIPEATIEAAWADLRSMVIAVLDPF